VRLYTEMIPPGAIVYGDRDRFLAFDECEHPVALQLGGSDPALMADAARAGAERGYDEINLNVGCPSDRVKSGKFGACLMAEPELVAANVRAMRDAVDPLGVPVTVKTRIGIDDLDAYEHLDRFVRTVADAGCEVFVIHARKAWLQGLSPKENRTIPPLRYDVVRRLKADHPELVIELNGGVNSLDHVEELVRPTDGVRLDGVMIGRAAYDDPFLLRDLDRRLFGDDHPVPTREEVLDRYVAYVERAMDEGAPLTRLVKHLFGLYHGVPGARAWRRHLSEEGRKPGAGAEVIRDAAAHVIAEPVDG